MLNFEIFEKFDDRCLNSFEELIPIHIVFSKTTIV